MAPCSQAFLPSQQTFRSLRRQAARERQDSVILHLRLELATAKHQISEWWQWWHTVNEHALYGSAKYACPDTQVDLLLSEFSPEASLEATYTGQIPEDLTNSAELNEVGE